jgi:hypothetical protein
MIRFGNRLGQVTMQFELDAARRFRESADAMRAIAAGETDIRTSGILDRIAEEYERTAADLEALDRANPDRPPLPSQRERDPSAAEVLAA